MDEAVLGDIPHFLFLNEIVEAHGVGDALVGCGRVLVGGEWLFHNYCIVVKYMKKK